MRLVVCCALLGGRSSQCAVLILPLLFANPLLPAPTEPYLVLVVELQQLTSLQAGDANVWVQAKAMSPAVNAPAVFLIKVLMEMVHLSISGEHTYTTALCRALWKKTMLPVTLPVGQYSTWRISKVTIWRRSGQGFLKGLSDGAQFPQLLFTLKPFSRIWELSACGGIQPLCKYAPMRAQGDLWTRQLLCWLWCCCYWLCLVIGVKLVC